jgi:hypothetical protein
MASWYSTKDSLHTARLRTQRRTRPFHDFDLHGSSSAAMLETITKEHRLGEIHHVWLPLPSTNSSNRERSEYFCPL